MAATLNSVFASKRQRRYGVGIWPVSSQSNPAAPFESQNLAPACGSLLKETAAAVIAALSLIGRVIGTGETLPALAPPHSSLAAVLTTLAQARPPSRLWLIGSRCHGAFLVRPADPTPGAHGCANSAACRRVMARLRLHERAPNPGPRGAALAYEGSVPLPRCGTPARRDPATLALALFVRSLAIACDRD